MQANIKINYFHTRAKKNAKTQSSMPSLNFSPLTARTSVPPTPPGPRLRRSRLCCWIQSSKNLALRGKLLATINLAWAVTLELCRTLCDITKPNTNRQRKNSRPNSLSCRGCGNMNPNDKMAVGTKHIQQKDAMRDRYHKSTLKKHTFNIK